MFYDAHAHLDLMSEEDLQVALKGAKDAKLSKIISCSTSFASNQVNLSLAKKYPQIEAAIGIYPLDGGELTKEEIDRAFVYFEKEIKNTIAIGEVGMDFKYSKNEEEEKKQEELFCRFIELSKKYDKPLIIHSRFAQRQVLNLLIENKAQKVLLHSFTDSPKLIKKAIENNYFVSCGLNVFFNEDTQRNVKEIDLNHLLLETDSPIRFNNEKTFPSDIVKVAEKVAELRKISPKEVESAQEANFNKLFV